ncbi:MAG: carbohydrate-binding family 6 protein [Vicinamibacteraceae bacterium]
MPTLAFARLSGLVTMLALTASLAQAQPRTVIAVDPADKAAAFGAGELSGAIASWRVPVTVVAPPQLAKESAPNVVVITTEAGKLAGQPVVTGLAAQGFAIRRIAAGGTTRWWAIGHDAAGAMYAALELAEAARIDGHLGNVVERQVNPFIAQRGIKFNIPLDARTPSYSDDSTSGQANIPDMWEMAFWTRFLDEMARHRYNVLSLWSLSPFPSLVKVPEYPKVALADVKRKTGAIFDATNQGRNMYDPSWPLETVKTMTIDEKIAFWRGVMQYARDRGIDVSVFTWNIFVYGTEGSGYGITVDPRNATTRDYVRRSTRALFATYPLLTAIGVTSGENMGDLDDAGKERWMWETYGLGVKDAMEDAANPASPFHRPGRKITLIHRAHQADLNAIVDTFKALPGSDRGLGESTLAFSFKYSQAHMHSSTAPKFIFQNGWYDSMPAGKQTWLTVRNDDLYYLRWGDPDFVRRYWQQLPRPDRIAGFMLGPDGYTWGRDFVSTTGATPRRLVIEKQWYWFLLWGRLAFEPSMPNQRFESILEARFPKAGPQVFQALSSMSKIVPFVNRFYWGYFDFMWYPEASWSQAGYVGVREFIAPKFPPMRDDEDGETLRVMSVKTFLERGSLAGHLTPLEVASEIDTLAEAGLDQLKSLPPDQDPELQETIGDIRAMAALGRHYAAKIRGAVELARYEKTKDAAAHARARTALQAAADHWREYARRWSAQYKGNVFTRLGPTLVDMTAIQGAVDKDIPAPLP